MFDEHPRMGNQAISEPLRGAEADAAARFLGLNGPDANRSIALKAHVFGQLGSGGVLEGGLLSDRLVTAAPGAGRAEIHHLVREFVDDNHVLVRVGLFLPL